MSYNVRSVVTGPFQENTHLIWRDGSSELIIIDPGDEPDILIDEITKIGQPLTILCTHAHLDHLGAAAVLSEEYHIPIQLHEKDQPVLDWFEDSFKLFGLEPRQKPVITDWITDESSISISGFDIQVLHTPGHTPGSTCFLIGDHLFTGDTLFAGTVGRTDLPGGNWDILQESLAKIMKGIKPETILHSGHGGDSTLAREIEQNPFLIPLRKAVDSQS